MSNQNLSLLACAGLFLLHGAAGADELILSTQPPLNVQALNLASIGDLAFDDGAAKLWVVDGSTNGKIYRLNPSTGVLLATIDPAVIPGLSSGPDAFAIPITPQPSELFVFSSFGESEGGRLTQAGALVTDFNTGLAATGADTDASGALWIATGTTIGGGSQLKRINATTGAVLQTVPILGSTSRVVDLTFDPHTGKCYCLFESNDVLTEINLSTGAQVSGTDLSPFLLQGHVVTGGVDFSTYGDKLFVGTGSGVAAETIIVLRRTFAALQCDGSGVFFPCPCANEGLPGRGCENSFNTGGGFLTETGVPRVTDDSYVLQVSGIPTTTTALFFQGTGTPESNPLVIGDGLMCVVGQVIRLATKTTTTGTAQFPAPGDLSLHVKGQVPSFGGTRFYQVWYRNPVNFCTVDTFNFSNGIKVFWTP